MRLNLYFPSQHLPTSGTPPRLAPRMPPGRQQVLQQAASAPRSFSRIAVPNPRVPVPGRCLCATANPGTQSLPKPGAPVPEAACSLPTSWEAPSSLSPWVQWGRDSSCSSLISCLPGAKLRVLGLTHLQALSPSRVNRMSRSPARLPHQICTPVTRLS